ncbi:MAG: hypothetical protein QOD77_1030 [Thermoplasmata archaeon]|jgi:hypothetical protein|nr:hypothetical protein [Thermoplasmata archaeon]
MKDTQRYNREKDEPRIGPARMFAIVFGIAYLAVALTEAILGLTGNTLMVGGVHVLGFTLAHNLVHWATGLLLVGVLGFGRWPTKLASRGVGFVFSAVFLLGLLAPELLGTVLGHGGMVPMSYNMIHLATGGLGLLAGFTSQAQPWMVRGATHHRLA